MFSEQINLIDFIIAVSGFVLQNYGHVEFLFRFLFTSSSLALI